MSNYYGSGLIGLDVKSRRRSRTRRNRYNTSFKWLLPVAVVIITLGLFVMGGYGKGGTMGKLKALFLEYGEDCLKRPKQITSENAEMIPLGEKESPCSHAAFLRDSHPIQANCTVLGIGREPER